MKSKADMESLARDVMEIVLKVAARRLVQSMEEVHDRSIKPMREALEKCQTRYPGSLDSDDATFRLREINSIVDKALGATALTSPDGNQP